MKTMTLATMTAGLILGTAANAEIIYVDAVEGAAGNTGITGEPLSDTSWVGPDSSAANTTQWSKRAFGTNATIFQALPVGDSSQLPELTTSISGLDDGLYDVWVFFQDQVTSETQNWVISAGLTSGDLQTYSAIGEPPVIGATASAVDASILNFSNTPVLTEGNGARKLFGVNLGTVSVTDGSDIAVYVDFLLDISNATTQRAFYDGVGYEVVPEPGSLALLGLGGLLLARRRRD